jgi:outer membrane autotransporter protein
LKANILVKKIFFIPMLGSAVAVWSPLMSSTALAREIVVLPGVVSPVGVVSGVDTQGPGTLTVGSQNINTSNDAGGAITTTAANTASIVFTGNSTVTGFVGATGSTFLNIAAGANASTVTFAGPVYATTFSLSGAGTVNFNGGFVSNSGSTMDFAGDGFINVGPGQTVKAAITNSAGAGTGTLTLQGNSILDGAAGAASGLKRINVTGGNALITGQANAASYSLGTNTLNVAGAFSIPVAGVINTTIFSPSVYGKIVPVGNSTIGNALQINVTVTGPIPNGTSFNIVDATSGTSGSTVIATDNSTRYLFSAAPTVNGRVVITTTQVPLIDVITPVVVPPVTPPGTTPPVTPVTPPVTVTPVIPLIIAPVIDALPITPVTTPVLTAITLLPDAQAVATALAQLGPGTTNFSSPQVAYLTTQRFQNLWTSHLAQVQGVCGQETPDRDRPQRENDFACGPDNMESHVWVGAYGYSGQQGDVGGFEGHRSNIQGVMIAYDTPLNENTLIGGGLRYAHAKVDANNSDNRGSINSYQATAYIGYAPGPWFANIALVAGKDNYTGSRHVMFTGVDSTMIADYNGHQYTAFGTTGYHFFIGDGRTVFTPMATLQYTRLHVSGYTESGDAALDLTVAARNYDFTQSGLGGKITRYIPLSASQTFRPEIHANWLHSFGNATMQNTAAFTSGGPAFTVTGRKLDRNTFNVGGGISLANNGSWSVEGVYDYEWRSDSYKAHQAMVKLAIHL